MKFHRKLAALFLSGALVLSLAACDGTGGSAATSPEPSASDSSAPSAAPSVSPSGSAAHPDDGYESTDAVSLTFSDGGITGSGEGFETDGTALTITAAGTYLLSGSCADGSVKVKKGVTGVTLVLSGLTLTSADTAPITCAKSSGVTIVAAAGTVNTLTDSAQNNDDSYPDNGNAENAVIKCKDGSQVTLRGSGTLNLIANGKNGIKAGATTDGEGEAWLTIRDLTLNIDAPVNDGINAEQLLTIESGAITVSAGDDGIHCDLTMNVGAKGTGGPTIVIEQCCEGLEAADLNILSGSITIHASDDCLNAANSDLSGYAFTLNISGGTLVMDTTGGDGIDSNGSLTISGGTVIVWTANTADNQPLDADGTISITGGTVLAAGGSAGMGMNLSAGQPYVIFGSGSFGGFGGGFPGQGGPGSQNSQSGEAQSSAQPQGGSQSSVSIKAGSTVEIKDADGNTVYSGTALCQAGYVIFSSADLVSGSSYTLYVDGSGAAEATAGTDAMSEGGPGGMGGMGRPGQNGQFTPPDGSGDGTAPTPPDGSDGTQPTPPSDGSGTPPTPPDGGNGGQNGQGGPGGQNGQPPAMPGGQQSSDSTNA